MPNAYVNKVIANGVTKIDLSADTVDAAHLLQGYTAHDRTGAAIVGTATGSGGGSDVQVATVNAYTNGGNNFLQFVDLLGEPTSFIILNTSGLSVTSEAMLASVAWDGTSYHGQTVSNTANAQVSALTTGFRHSYTAADGLLGVWSDDAYISSNDYTLIYTYDGSSGNIHTADVQVGSGATSITFPVEDEPIYFSCVFKSNFSTSSGYQRAICVAAISGVGTIGLEMDSSAKFSDTHWSVSYSNGSLTLTSQSTNAGGYFHQPGYYQLTYAVSGDQSMQTKTVTPTTSTQNITADTGYTGLKKVVVNPIPSSYVQPTSTVGATTYRASTSNQTINAGTYHSAAATIAAVSQTNLEAANIKSGTTISISNGQSNLWSVTGTYTGSGGGGSASVASTTWTNSSNTTTSHQFTGLSGTPKAAFLRCTSSLSRSSNSSNYFIADMVWDGTSCKGNSFRRSNGTYANVTSGYTVTTETNSITFTSSGTSTTNPGSFYNGGYELVYVY